MHLNKGGFLKVLKIIIYFLNLLTVFALVPLLDFSILYLLPIIMLLLLYLIIFYDIVFINDKKAKYLLMFINFIVVLYFGINLLLSMFAGSNNEEFLQNLPMIIVFIGPIWLINLLTFFILLFSFFVSRKAKID